MKNHILAVLAIMGMAAHGAEYTWRVPSSVPEGTPVYDQFLVRFADNARRLTGGRVEIQPFGAGVITPALKVFESVEQGVVEAGHSTSSYLINQNPSNAVFSGFPGSMGPNAYKSWLYEGGGLQALDELRATSGLKSLVIGIGSSEIFAHANKPIQSADDLKHMKFRTSGPWGEVLKTYYGAVPTVVPAGEIYTLLQRKGVDAIEWSTPYANLPEGYQQAAKYIIIPGIHQPTFMWEFTLQKSRWDALPEDIRAALQDAAVLTTAQALDAFYHEDMAAMQKLRESPKNEVLVLPDAFVQDLGEKGYQWMHDMAEKNPDMKPLLDNYEAYHRRWKAQSGFLIKD